VTEHRLEIADVFRQHGQEFLNRWGDVLSTQQRKAFRDIGVCRTAALGTQVQQCDHCGHQEIAYDRAVTVIALSATAGRGMSGCVIEQRRFCRYHIVTLFSRCLMN
jgi:hypothetical protein